ncbi:MAG: energy transducer TonB [Deltaproteobacteria bacterium]|nr:energy transducer TonB [Deltaproteobacteria bacterium]
MNVADFSDDIGGDLDAISGDFIFREEAVDTAPQVLSRAMPTYPWWAEKSGKEGFVVFRLKLNVQGRIEKLWVEQSTPTGVFDEAAEKAIRQYRFSPAIYKGNPVPVICKQKIVFQLGG